MSEKLLRRVRQLNQLLSESTTGYVSFDELCESFGEMMNSEVYILSKKGKILATNHEGSDIPITIRKEGDSSLITRALNSTFLSIHEAKENLIGEDVTEIYGSDYNLADSYHSIIPVIFGGNRVATVIFIRMGDIYSDEDIAIMEYGATVVGIEVSRSIALEEEEETRKRNAVNMALETLSYSELDAVVKIFGELNGNEGLLVASKVADKFSITRSVIVNALRKLESAGVIESRSLGMKGTRIKITNPYLREQIEAINI
ncbi:MAG: GTP-sensing pleiotropic transcriptional regulator CodY [Eubacteriales bacterium]|nr:GTP-sensing pleiotropic transcriptional regulator CodY [Eubacteriales bacterium]